MQNSNAAFPDHRVHHYSNFGMCAHGWVIVVLATHAALTAAIGGGRVGVAVLFARAGAGSIEGVPRGLDEVSPLESHSWVIGPGEPLALRMEYSGPQKDVQATGGDGTIKVSGNIHNQEPGVQPNSVLKGGVGSGFPRPANRTFVPVSAADAGDDARRFSRPTVGHQLDSDRADIVPGDGGEPRGPGNGRAFSAGYGSPDAENQTVTGPTSAGAEPIDTAGHGAEVELPQPAGGGGEGPRDGVKVGTFLILVDEFLRFLCNANYIL